MSEEIEIEIETEKSEEHGESVKNIFLLKERFEINFQAPLKRI
jgi:hypothetical protein